MKKLIILIAVIIFIGYLFRSGNSNESYYDSISTELAEQNWSQAHGTEFAEISKALAKNNIRVCGEFHVKLVGNGEYVVACTPDGQSWNYFIVWSKNGSAYKADYQTKMNAGKPY